MASLGDQQTWVPYDSTKDCSQGFCSVYCPQWCYIVFPPPPPLDDVSGGGGDSSGAAFSPLVIAIIGILASAFLLVTYYTVISRYCSRFPRRNIRRGRDPEDPAAPPPPGAPGGGGWHAPAAQGGIEEALISKISVYKYRRGEGVVDGTDCSVCLGEFRDEERLRLLPKCSHAFHVHCIDTWLKSSPNCPLCRANIASLVLHLPPPPPLPPPPTVQEPPSIAENPRAPDAENVPDKEPTVLVHDKRHTHPQGVRRSASMGSSPCGRFSIADVLRVSIEDEVMSVAAATSRAGPSRRGHGKSRDRALHCVISPVAMKRSSSSTTARFSFTTSIVPHHHHRQQQQ